MAKIGSQNRLLIPRDLTNLLKLHGKIGIFWDREEKALYLNKLEETNNDFLICIKSLDNKNRISLSQKILKLIEANYSSEFIIALRKKRIYIIKLTEE